MCDNATSGGKKSVKVTSWSLDYIPV